MALERATFALWGVLAEFMHRSELDTMVGCASVSMRDGGHFAASLREQSRHAHLAPIEWRVSPPLAQPVDELRRDLPLEPSALIKRHLPCGA